MRHHLTYSDQWTKDEDLNLNEDEYIKFDLNCPQPLGGCIWKQKQLINNWQRAKVEHSEQHGDAELDSRRHLLQGGADQKGGIGMEEVQ
jgi:hypothetical protein